MTDRTSKFLVLALVLIFATHLFGMSQEYSPQFWWLDDALHFFGGAWLAVFALWFLFAHKNYSIDEWPGGLLLIGLTAFAVLGGVWWEFFEFGWDYFLAGPYGLIEAQRSLVDTMSDLFFDFLGALAASVYFIYFHKRRLVE